MGIIFLWQEMEILGLDTGNLQTGWLDIRSVRRPQVRKKFYYALTGYQDLLKVLQIPIQDTYLIRLGRYLGTPNFDGSWGCQITSKKILPIFKLLSFNIKSEQPLDFFIEPIY